MSPSPGCMRWMPDLTPWFVWANPPATPQSTCSRCTPPSQYLVIPLSYLVRLTQDGDMRVLLKLVLDCSPDAAWHAIREPAVMKDVAFPLMNFTSLESSGFPESWPAGEHQVSVTAFGVVPLGEQVIAISF